MEEKRARCTGGDPLRFSIYAHGEYRQRQQTRLSSGNGACFVPVPVNIVLIGRLSCFPRGLTLHGLCTPVFSITSGHHTRQIRSKVLFIRIQSLLCYFKPRLIDGKFGAMMSVNLTNEVCNQIPHDMTLTLSYNVFPGAYNTHT